MSNNSNVVDWLKAELVARRDELERCVAETDSDDIVITLGIDYAARRLLISCRPETEAGGSGRTAGDATIH